MMQRGESLFRSSPLLLRLVLTAAKPEGVYEMGAAADESNFNLDLFRLEGEAQCILDSPNRAEMFFPRSPAEVSTSLSSSCVTACIFAHMR
jgi:hypothetical protein